MTAQLPNSLTETWKVKNCKGQNMQIHPTTLENLLNSLIHEVATRSQLLMSGNGEALDKVRAYIKSNPELIREELKDMALAASQGKVNGNLRNLLIKRYRDLTGSSMQEAKEAVDKWQEETLG